MLNSRFKLFSSFAVIALSIFVLSNEMPSIPSSLGVSGSQAAVFNVDNVTPTDLLETYEQISPTTETKIRVFLMPGHEPTYGGAEYRNVKERNMNAIIAKHLEEYLTNDGHYEVVVGRDEKSWNSELENYFKNNWEGIKKWKDELAVIMNQKVADGDVNMLENPIPRQTVQNDVALRLYGINKWVGENDFDMAIHLHINDYGSRPWNRSGTLSGYVVYVPESQYSNSAAAKMVAQAISTRLDQFFPQSDAKRETGGVVEDQELVALGRYNTADAPALLIEYGYIYESQFQKKDIQELALKEYAYQTYLGLKEFFATDPNEGFVFKTATLPYTWTKDVRLIGEQNADVFALQIALHKYGFYPPDKKTLTDCPLSGVFGGCTKTALRMFQKQYVITGEDGIVGENTRATLNALYK